MDNKMTVYHGLDKELLFTRFTAFFNQPLSTTVSFKAGQEFAKGSGITLSFKRCKNDDRSPKFMDVEWISDFAKEKERFFYGQNIKFQIVDIMPSSSNTKHRRHLKAYNLFEHLLRNETINWNDNGIG
eukprot:165241_1